MQRSWLTVMGLIVAASISWSDAFAQGRGQLPPVPPPQNPQPDRFPGFPPNAGAGRPHSIPAPNEHANPRALGPREPAGVEPEFATAGPVDQLSRTPRLAERLEGMLTIPEGMTLDDMAEGFPNLGLFVATVQVSNNVEGTTFDGLKSRMLDGEGMSLGQAISDETRIDDETAGDIAAESEEQAQELIENTDEATEEPIENTD